MCLNIRLLAQLQAPQLATRERAQGWVGMVPADLNCGRWARPLMNKRILLADDDISVRETLGRVLELGHYDAVLAGSGREGVATCRAAAPDLVLLDLDVPDQNGWQAFAAMSSVARGVPVLIITAVPHQAKRAAQPGASALLEKPLDLPRLLETVGDLLDRAVGGPCVRTTGSHAEIRILPAWTKAQPNCTGGTC